MTSRFGCSKMVAVAVLVTQWLALAPVVAQNWPTRPVRLILPFGPGSGADTAARLLTDKLQSIWGQPVVVDGKPGGDGILSVSTVLNANDDHTFFFGPSSVYVVQSYLHPDLSYDPEKALEPIVGVAKVEIAIAVPANIGVSNLRDFLALARANPNKVSYAVAPGFSEFVFDGFVRENKLQIAKVPYRDITTSPMDLGENRIQLSMQSYAAMKTYEQTGKIKIIAINNLERSAIAPDVPSVAELGFPSLAASPVLGFLGSRIVSRELAQKVARDVLSALDDSVVADRLRLTGQLVAPLGVETFSAAVAEQYAQVARIAAVLGLSRKQ